MRPSRSPEILIALVLSCLAGCGGRGSDKGRQDGGEGGRGEGQDGSDDARPDAAIDGAVDAATDAAVDAATDGAVDAAVVPGDAAIADVSTVDAPACWVPGGDCLCGGAGQPCCFSGLGPAACSEPGTVCAVAPGMSLACLACGAPGQPCCAGNACRNGGCCVRQPSDAGDQSICTASGGACPVSTAGTCSASQSTPASCGACGALGQPCCAASGVGVCTAPNTYCLSSSSSSPEGTCAACGGEGQPCCGPDSSASSRAARFGICNPGLHCPQAVSATCQVLPIGCAQASCGAGSHCNAWAGRCEPDGSPSPPPGRDNGEPCASDADCRSATGVGMSVVPACSRTDGEWPGGYCLSYCNVPPGGFWTNPLSRSNCPVGSICLPSFQHPFGERYGACARECRSDSDCRVAEGYYCRRNFRFTGPVFSNGYCAPVHCRSRGCPSLKCGC